MSLRLLLLLGVALAATTTTRPTFVHASAGDTSDVFRTCTQRCLQLTCDHQRLLANSVFDLNQPLYMRLLGWDCPAECHYECMWHTVDIFEHVYKREDTPQFFGKWPFVRLLGMQEPLSAIASLLNFAAHALMLRRMQRDLHRPKEHLAASPMRALYRLFGYVCLNTWAWSTIFHTKDTPFTEKMDYFCAFALTLAQLALFWVRVLSAARPGASRLARTTLYGLLSASGVYYAYHVYYLGFVHFDYGYNMRVNIQVGVLNSVCWLVWSYHAYFRRGRVYAWRCAASVLLVDALMVFEVFDFAPIWWTVDAHALWHLSTVVIPFVWYPFLVDDVHYLENYEKVY